MITIKQFNNSKNLKSFNKKAFEKKEQKDELSYLSSIAFEQFAVTNSEIDNLKRLINKMGELKKGNDLNTIFLSVMFGLLIAISVFFIIFNKNKNQPFSYQLATEMNIDKKLKNLVLPTDTLFPEFKQVYKISAIEHYNSDLTRINIEEVLHETIETKAVPIEIAQVEENQELILKFSPNAPIVYISNLKVTNYRLYYFKLNQGIDLTINTGLAAQYESNRNIDNTKMNRTNAFFAHKIIQRAMFDFNNKNISSSIEHLTLLYDFNKKDANAEFYLGLCYYSLGKYAVAQTFFTKNRDNENNIFHQESEFYEALCMLENKQTEAARAQLQSIVASKGFYSERAKIELLK